MKFILGINAYHADAAAALIKDGKVIIAVEEERFTRIKHNAGFPLNAIKWCLEQTNLKISNVDDIAINTNPRSNLHRKLIYSLFGKPEISLILSKIKNRRKKNSLKSVFEEYFPNSKIKAKFHFIDHHLAHLASAFYPSKFPQSFVISVDGFGDFSSAAWGYGYENNLEIDGKILFPHSLGAFYTSITQFLGFHNYGDEYKVMGLAPYGKPRYMKEMNQLISIKNNGKFELNKIYFPHATKNLKHQWLEGKPIVAKHFNEKFVDLFGPQRDKNQPITQRHKDIAFSAQKIYEEAFFNMLNTFSVKYDTENICLAGGCGANSVANGKITTHTKLKNVYVASAPGDAGGALGAGLAVWYKSAQNFNCNNNLSPYLGCSYSNKTINLLLDNPIIAEQLNDQNCEVCKLGEEGFQNEEAFLKVIAQNIFEGKVVGWFQGSMEWGPRALGNRSILGNPCRKDMKDILNLKIKRRESFRPFAPSVLLEEVNNWFDINLDVPYMMQVLPIKVSKQHLIPAVTHVDGTGRLQTVSKTGNKRYYRLIKNFFEISNVPMVL
ncbi:carbamoyltransferase, partial [Prochlorococcus sp. AH-716-M06]|nr:carbamoyltransferase [Prochlorococcus sp. AH-716-M06]